METSTFETPVPSRLRVGGGREGVRDASPAEIVLDPERREGKPPRRRDVGEAVAVSRVPGAVHLATEDAVVSRVGSVHHRIAVRVDEPTGLEDDPKELSGRRPVGRIGAARARRDEPIEASGHASRERPVLAAVRESDRVLLRVVDGAVVRDGRGVVVPGEESRGREGAPRDRRAIVPVRRRAEDASPVLAESREARAGRRRDGPGVALADASRSGNSRGSSPDRPSRSARPSGRGTCRRRRRGGRSGSRIFRSSTRARVSRARPGRTRGVRERIRERVRDPRRPWGAR